MLIKKEIIGRLQGSSQRMQVAFAARCALRVLPLLAEEPSADYKSKDGMLDRALWASERKSVDPFWYWPVEDRLKHLLSILTAQQVSVNFAASGGKFDTNGFSPSIKVPRTTAAIIDATRAAIFSSVDGTDSAVIAAIYARAADASAALHTANSGNATTVIYVSGTRDGLENEMINDLKQLARFKDPLDLLNMPLMMESPPDLWKTYQARFYDWVGALEAGFEVWLDWYDHRMAGEPLDVDLLNKQASIPAAIKEHRVKAANTYLASLVSKAADKPVNQVRAIFIGHGASGKTSLIRAMHREPVVEGKEDMTPGIAIRSWQEENAEISAMLWDFGGQVIAHATHQFFLRECCLYVVVLDARAEFNANDQAEYWLEHVKAFGKGSAVMLVGNKSDLGAVNLDMRALQEKYPNIVGFYPISCTQYRDGYQSHFATFKHDFIKYLQEAGTSQEYFLILKWR